MIMENNTKQPTKILPDSFLREKASCSTFCTVSLEDTYTEIIHALRIPLYALTCSKNERPFHCSIVATPLNWAPIRIHTCVTKAESERGRTMMWMTTKKKGTMLDRFQPLLQQFRPRKGKVKPVSHLRLATPNIHSSGVRASLFRESTER